MVLSAPLAIPSKYDVKTYSGVGGLESSAFGALEALGSACAAGGSWLPAFSPLTGLSWPLRKEAGRTHDFSCLVSVPMSALDETTISALSDVLRLVMVFSRAVP